MENRSIRQSKYSAAEGYSLLQTSFALVVMGLLIAILVPRMLELVEDARDAKVKAVASGFKAAVYLARESWYAAGKPAGVVENFGERNLLMSVKGWPVSVVGMAGSENQITDPVCQGLWKALLVEGAPEVGTAKQLELKRTNQANRFDQVVIEFMASAQEGKCRYYYLEGDDERFIQYDPANGRIISKIR